MAGNLRPVQAPPTRTIVIDNSVRLSAVDENAEQSLGSEVRNEIRTKRDIGPSNSILHPDLDSFTVRAQIIAQKPLADVGANGIREKGKLGPGLEKFVGNWVGNGFNMILRPQNGVGKAQIPIIPKPASGPTTRPNPRETLLECNFTHETMSFLDQNVLGDVPNRGFDLQEDLNLRGVPYTQIIKDLANGATGKADLDPKDEDTRTIHFEQGLFMRTPALIPFKDDQFKDRADQILSATITRMASIPHGTTINAQAPEPPGIAITSAPNFGRLDIPIIFPFPLLAENPIDAAVRDFFPQLEPPNLRTENFPDRIPINFSKFMDTNTIDQRRLYNPNNFLAANNKLKKIRSHVNFKVDSKPSIKVWGGGTDNIAQLAEREKNFSGVIRTHKAGVDGASTANANAVHVTCEYWISEVEDVITIPPYEKAKLELVAGETDRSKPDNLKWPEVAPEPVQGIKKPRFSIRLEGVDKVDKAFKATVKYTQIQYSQNVTLDFGGLSWPHISVASLVPLDALPVVKKGLDWTPLP